MGFNNYLIFKLLLTATFKSIFAKQEFLFFLIARSKVARIYL